MPGTFKGTKSFSHATLCYRHIWSGWQWVNIQEETFICSGILYNIFIVELFYILILHISRIHNFSFAFVYSTLYSIVLHVQTGNLDRYVCEVWYRSQKNTTAKTLPSTAAAEINEMQPPLLVSDVSRHIFGGFPGKISRASPRELYP